MTLQAASLFELPKKKPRAVVPSAEELTVYDLLDALWTRCARAVNHSMTKTMWKGRYKAIALDMVRAGVTVERALAAHAAVTLAVGYPVYSLRVIQDELVRIQAKSLRPESETRIVLDDGSMIEGNKFDPPTLAELVRARSV